ncbi:MAG TPA: flagellar hook-associated protein FlgL [Anaeromyxobacter sp.]|nr:flagellar hook-associated protein FlgL [Anaeromyxobacter sp.]
MRVTDAMLYERAAQDCSSARSRMDEATSEVSSGKKLSQPGDDPAASGLVVLEQMRKNQFDAIASAAGRASDELSAADGALNTVDNALSRARELAVQLSNGTYSASDRAAGAAEVTGLISTIVSALNTQVGNRYVFGGTQDGTAPFSGVVTDTSGNVDPALTGAYHGDAGVRQVEIAPGVLQDVSVRADVALKGVGGGSDVLATLANLANALTANDPAAVGATLDGLTQGTTQVATARSVAGADVDTLTAAVNASQAASADATKRISGLADADPIQSASDLAAAQTALQASLTAVGESFKFSLLNYL